MPAAKNILGVHIAAIDYAAAVEFVCACIRHRRGAIISAMAVHGVMSGVLDARRRLRLNQFDLLVPDGQPVRWALNWLHGTRLRDRVYGPEFMRRICARAASEGASIYLYGSTAAVVTALAARLVSLFPSIRIAGCEPSVFRELTPAEQFALQHRIQSSGAAVVFVGLGCPRQEDFAYDFRGRIAAPMLTVGAAFPLLAGVLPQAPPWMQRAGLEWLFRLAAEPRRLWRRYLLLNPAYIALVALQRCGFRAFGAASPPPETNRRLP